MKWIQNVGLLVCVLGLMVGCSGDEDASEAQACVPGVTQECACPDQYQEAKGLERMVAGQNAIRFQFQGGHFLGLASRRCYLC